MPGPPLKGATVIVTAPPVIDPFMDGLPTLRTARLALRHPRAGDALSVLQVFGDREALRYWSHEPLPDLAAACAYLARIDEGCQTRILFQWAVTRPPDDLLVGTVTLAGLDPQNRRAEIGFMLRRDLHGQGLAREAAAAVLAFAFDRMGLHRIEADVHPDNRPSRGLLARLGFKEEGLLRERWFTFGAWSDSIVLGLLASERVR